MKKLLFASLIVLSSFCFAQTRSILFIGNSYTYYNGGVDEMLKNIALAGGDTLYTESFTVGAAKFSDFCNNPETFERIRSRAWDYVVLQEQSQLPAFPPEDVETQCYPYAKKLCDSIHANDSCTQILFFMTWGRQNGDQENCGSYEPLCTYDGMQQRLRESYVQMADDNNAIVVPVGLAWKYVRDNYPEINLYQSDESHPTLEGTYLAALTFYNAMQYEGYNYVPESIEAQTLTAWRLYRSVSHTIMNYMEECNLKDLLFVKFEPIMYTKTKIATEILVSMNENCDSCVLSFSSGMTETYYPNYHGTEVFVNLRNFLEPGQNTVNVCATVYQGDCSFSICDDFMYVISGIEEDSLRNFNIVNPIINGKLQFESDVMGNYEIYSIEGRLLDSGFVSGCEIDVSQLKNGVYMIRIGERTEKFVVNN